MNVTYKLDIFGGARRAVEGARAQAEVAQFQLEGAYLSLTGNVVTAAVKEAALRAQMLATEDAINVAALHTHLPLWRDTTMAWRASHYRRKPPATLSYAIPQCSHFPILKPLARS